MAQRSTPPSPVIAATLGIFLIEYPAVSLCLEINDLSAWDHTDILDCPGKSGLCLVVWASRVIGITCKPETALQRS